MKPVRPLIITLAALLFPFALLYVGIWAVLGPIHDYRGVRNTAYSPKFTPDKFKSIAIGTPRTTLIETLGEPFATDVLTNYPVWALSEESVRRHYGTNTVLPEIVELHFSRPRNGGDYDRAIAWIGPETNVIYINRGVTD